jgi:hypothetical protein
MEVPANLIKLIEEGIATYHVAPLGVGGAYSLPCPENKYIVIFGFTYNHFLDGFEDDSPTLFQEVRKFEKVITHVQFQSRQQRFIYNFRTQPVFIELPPPSVIAFKKLFPSNPAENIPCYQIHKSDVNITLWHPPPTGGWAFTYAPVPDQQGTLENKPLGIGWGAVGLSAINELRVLPAAFPTWKTNPVDKNNTKDGNRFAFVTPVTSAAVIKAPIQSGYPEVDGLQSFPLLNVYYCIINQPAKSTNRN